MKAFLSALLLMACACHKPVDAGPDPTSSASPPAPSANSIATGAAAPSETAAPTTSAEDLLPAMGNQLSMIETDDDLASGARDADGGLSPETVARVVRKNSQSIKACYNEGLRTDPGLAGKVSIKFVINPDGSVANATSDAKTTMRNADVVACIARACSKLSFPPFHGKSVTVTFPFVFMRGN